MQQLGDYLDQKRHDEIINEILDLKMSKDQTQETKKRIQKLQQELSEVEYRLKL